MARKRAIGRMGLLAGLLVLLGASPLWAHPSPADSGGGWAGWWHPFSGWEHWLLAIAWGGWSARLGGRRAAMLTLAMLGILAAGWAGSYAFGFRWASGAGLGLAACLFLATALACLSVRDLPAALGCWCLLPAALLHGHSHAEHYAALAQPLASAVAGLVATLVLAGSSHAVCRAWLRDEQGALAWRCAAAAVLACALLTIGMR